MGTFLRALAGGFVGKLLCALFIAVCIALGIGPDKWASFVIGELLTPTLARVVFIALAVVTGLILWSVRTPGQRGRQPALDHGVRMYFDPLKHRLEMGEWTAFCVGVRNGNALPVEKVLVTIDRIESVNENEDHRDALDRFENVPLIDARRFDDRTEIPPKETYLFGKQEIAFALVAFAPGGDSPSLRVCHNVFRFGMLSMRGMPLRNPMIDELIPLGKYRFRINLRASDGTNCTKSFIVVATKKPRFEVTEEVVG